MGILPDAPVFDFSVERRWVRLLILASGAMLLLALLIGMLRVPVPSGVFDWPRIALLLFAGGGAIVITLACWFDRVRLYSVLSLGEIVFVRAGRVRWRMRYDDLADCAGSMAEGKVILRDKTGRGRRLPARTRDDQAIIISAIDDVLTRYRAENGVLSSTRAAGFGLRDRATSHESLQSEG